MSRATTTSVPKRVVIGLDVGTTSVKAAAFAPGSSWRATAVRDLSLANPTGMQYVQDPDEIVVATAVALAECVGACGSAEVAAVSVGAAMHGLIALDDSHRPLTPLVTWADGRSVEEAQSLHRTGIASALHETTGVPVHPMSPLTKLLWFARHEPDLWRRARWWIGLKDLLLLWLTGSLVTELSSASSTGLLQMSTLTWSPVALELAGLSPDQLPSILSPTSISPMGTAAAKQVGLPPGTPIVAGAADGPLGNLGTGATAPGIAGLSAGTSGAIRAVVDSPRVDARHRLFCYALTESAWVIGGAISNGGAVGQWATDAFIDGSTSNDATPSGRTSIEDDHALGDAALEALGDAALELAASVPEGSDGLVMLPYLLPERAPLWDPDLAGAYLGVHHRHTRAHFVRAAIEGVCMQMRLILDQLDSVSNVERVHATGGVFRSSLWREVMAATLDRPFYVFDSVDGTALAAAALGLFAVGQATSPDDAVAQLGGTSWRHQRPIEVSPATASRYRELRASVPGLIHQLGPIATVFGTTRAADD